MAYFKLFLLSLVVKKRLFVEYLRVIFRYYGNATFRKVDLALLGHYFLRSPYKVSKDFLVQAGEADPHTYGETPLTTLEQVARECGIHPTDTVFELGCGRGRGCFWWACFWGCQAVGIEYIPEFMANAESVKQAQNIDRVTFILEDMRTCSYRDATVLYLYGTCFDDAFLEQLMRSLLEVPQGTKIITVSYPLTDYTSHGFRLLKQFEAEFTWGLADVYLQVRE